MADIKYEIVEQIGVLSESANAACTYNAVTGV